jgi:hypothetical protein
MLRGGKVHTLTVKKLRLLKQLRIAQLRKLEEQAERRMLEELRDDEDGGPDAEVEETKALASAEDATRNTLKVGVSYGEPCTGPCVYDGVSKPTCKTKPHGLLRRTTATCIPDYVVRSGGRYGVSADASRPCYSACDASGLCLDEHSDPVKCMDTSQVQRLVSSFASGVNKVSAKQLFQLGKQGAQALVRFERRAAAIAARNKKRKTHSARALAFVKEQLNTAEAHVKTCTAAFGQMVDFLFHTMVGRGMRYKPSAMSMVLMWVTQGVSMVEDAMRLMMEYYGDPTNGARLSDIESLKNRLVKLQETSRKEVSEGDFVERRALGDVLVETFGSLASKAYVVLDHWAFKVAVAGFALNVIFQRLNMGDHSFTFGDQLKDFTFTRMSIDARTSWLVRNNMGWLLSPVVNGSWNYILQVLFVSCMMFFDSNDPRAVATRHILIYGWVRKAIQWVDAKTLGKFKSGVLGTTLGNPVLRLGIATGVYTAVTKLLDTMGRFACQFIMYMRESGYADMQQDKVWTGALNDSWFGNLLDYVPTDTQPFGTKIAEDVMAQMMAKGTKSVHESGVFNNLVRSGAAVADLAKRGELGQWVNTGEVVQAAVIRYLHEGKVSDGAISRFVSTRAAVLRAGQNGAIRIQNVSKMQYTYTFGTDEDMKEEMTAALKETNGAAVGLNLAAELGLSSDQLDHITYGGPKGIDTLTDAQILMIRDKMGSKNLVQQFVTQHKSALELFSSEHDQGLARDRLSGLQSLMTSSTFASNAPVRGKGDGASVEDLAANSVFASLIEGSNDIVEMYTQLEWDAMKQAYKQSDTDAGVEGSVDAEYIKLWRESMRGKVDPLVRNMHFRSQGMTLQGMWQYWTAGSKGDGSVVQGMSSQQYLNLSLKALEGAATYDADHVSTDGWSAVSAISTKEIASHAQNALQLDNVVKTFASKAFGSASLRRKGSFTKRTETVAERRLREELLKSDKLNAENERLKSKLDGALRKNNEQKKQFEKRAAELRKQLKNESLSEEKREALQKELDEAEGGVEWMKQQKLRLDEEAKALDKELKESAEANKKLESDLAQQRQLVYNKKKLLESSDKELKKLDAQAKKLQSQATAAEKRARAAQDKVEAANAKVAAAEDAATEASDRVRKLQEAGASEADVRKAIAQREARIAEVEAATAAQVKVLEKQEAAARTATEKAEKLRSAAEQAAADAESRRQSKMAEIEEMEAKLRSLAALETEKKKDVDTLNQQVQNMGLSAEENAAAKAEYEAKLEEAQQQVSEARDNATRLQDSLSEAQSAASAAQQQVAELAASASASTAEKAEAERALAAAQKLASAAQAEATAAKAAESAARSETDALKVRFDALNRRVTAADELVAQLGEESREAQAAAALDVAATLPSVTGDALVETSASWITNARASLDKQWTDEQEALIIEVYEALLEEDKSAAIELPKLLQGFGGVTASKVSFADAWLAYTAADFSDNSSMEAARGEVMIEVSEDYTTNIAQFMKKVAQENMVGTMNKLLSGEKSVVFSAMFANAGIGDTDDALDTAQHLNTSA